MAPINHFHCFCIDISSTRTYTVSKPAHALCAYVHNHADSLLTIWMNGSITLNFRPREELVDQQSALSAGPKQVLGYSWR